MEKQNQDQIISLLRGEIPENNNNVYFILYKYLTLCYVNTTKAYYHELFKSRCVELIIVVIIVYIEMWAGFMNLNLDSGVFLSVCHE